MTEDVIDSDVICGVSGHLGYLKHAFAKNVKVRVKYQMEIAELSRCHGLLAC